MDGTSGSFCLPMPDGQIQRMIERMGLEDQNVPLRIVMAEPGDIMAVCQLAENLEQFDFITGIQSPEEYGRHMIQESGRFEYDSNLEEFYDYRLYGEQRIRREGGSFNE